MEVTSDLLKMAAFTHLSRKFLLTSIKSESRLNLKISCTACIRLLSYSSKEYDGNPDPAPIFIKNEVQSLLKTLTRVDLAKVYKKRKLGEKRLNQPVYKFLTDQQLQEAMNEVKAKVDEMIQIPPVVAVRKPPNKILSEDPELQGLDSATFVFTDITFGLRDAERLIVVREPNGILKEADWEMRDRINQLYFPVKHRSIKMPLMFEDDYLEDILKRREYEFILDRACLQFEPNDAQYQRVVSITYQHINDNNAFDVLRSTRHFGSLAFFLTWHKMIDNLLLELIETDNMTEAYALVNLYGQVHSHKFEQGEKVSSIEEYIQKFSHKRGSLELAIQTAKERISQKQKLEKGIQRAHGLG